MSFDPGPLEIRDQLAALLTAIERDDRMIAELERAKREFFGPHTQLHADPSAREQSAVRFAEWYLCERESELLGQIPIVIAGERFGADVDLLEESIVGVFLVQSSGSEPVVRDIVHGDTFDLCQVPNPIEIGDVLIGRLFAASDGSGSHVPSAAMSIVSAAPNFAITYKREAEELGLDRRLTQAEIEHLLFLERVAVDEPAPPLEHVEAQLSKLLDDAGRSEYQATDISDALRESDRPAAVVEALLDELAFETDIDLNEARRLLLIMSASVNQLDPPDATEAIDATPRPQDTPRAAVRPPRATNFEPLADEKLGEQLARRIEQGLTGAEDVDSVFTGVEGILGESLSDDDDELAPFDDGDLEPLVREFEWELEPDVVDRERLRGFIATQRNAPVPRTTLESIERDDLLRFLLHAWLDAALDQRVDEVRSRYALLERFYSWAAANQAIDRAAELSAARDAFVVEIERLQGAALALSPDAQPRRDVSLCVVTDVARGQARLEATDTEEVITVALGADGDDRLLIEDLVIGAVDRANATLVGMVVVIPGQLQHLLG